MKFKLLLAAILFFSCLVHAAHDEASPAGKTSMQSFCQSHPCRGKTTIRLKTGGEEFFDEVPMFWPVIQQGAISILPGEELFIEADIAGDSLVDLVSVKENTNPEKTLELKFEQNDKSVAMMLSVSNPFDKPVKFTVEMMDFNGDFHQTSSCPVMPGAAIYESWPHPILQLIISNPRLMAEDEEAVCE